MTSGPSGSKRSSAQRDRVRLGLAMAAGIAVAFPAGIMFAGRSEPERREQIDRWPPADHRQVFSPRVLQDPHFRAEQRRNVERLEQHCHETGELCTEATQARAWLEGLTD